MWHFTEMSDDVLMPFENAINFLDKCGLTNQTQVLGMNMLLVSLIT